MTKDEIIQAIKRLATMLPSATANTSEVIRVRDALFALAEQIGSEPPCCVLTSFTHLHNFVVAGDNQRAVDLAIGVGKTVDASWSKAAEYAELGRKAQDLLADLFRPGGVFSGVLKDGDRFIEDGIQWLVEQSKSLAGASECPGPIVWEALQQSFLNSLPPGSVVTIQLPK